MFDGTARFYRPLIILVAVWWFFFYCLFGVSASCSLAEKAFCPILLQMVEKHVEQVLWTHPFLRILMLTSRSASFHQDLFYFYLQRS